MTNMHQLTQHVEIEQIVPPASNSGAVDSAAIDMEGWDGVMIVLNAGVVAATGTLNALIEAAVDDAFTTPIEIANSAMAEMTDANDVTTVVWDISGFIRWQYLRLALTGATAAAIYGATAIKYRGRGGFPKDNDGVQELILLPQPAAAA
jgi:hypothetical protein